jgi:hypothetical protein
MRNAPTIPAMPTGPWLLVVGMHRSGTSAVTGALGRLGFAVPAEGDRYEPSDDNPDHFESQAIGLHDAALLERLGTTWDRPPETEWQSDDRTLRQLDELGDPAVPANEAFPKPGPLVWKDPRSCLLLPYWLAHLPKPVAAVFIWRSPLSVASSLHTRDGLHRADGLALWERYNRSGLAGLAGLDTFVTRYESIVEDPVGRLGDLVSWLGDLPQFAAYARDWDLPAAAATISPQLVRERVSGDSELLLDGQRQLVELLDSLHGPHRPLTSRLAGKESPWTTALLHDRHELASLSLERDAFREDARLKGWEIHGLAAHLAGARDQVEQLNTRITALTEEFQRELAGAYELLERMKSSTSWKVTRPLRQLTTLRLRDRRDAPPPV